jgi:hypothetical protein
MIYCQIYAREEDYCSQMAHRSSLVILKYLVLVRKDFKKS